MFKVITILTFFGLALGYPSGNQKVINGRDAQQGEFPWQVSLQTESGDPYWHFCGGSIISPTYIMTAAHCKKLPARVTVYVGSVDKFNGGTRHTVFSFISHPSYDSATITWDYGLVRLNQAVDTTNNAIQVIQIPADEDSTINYAGEAITTGWGYIYYEGNSDPDNKLPQILQVGEIPVLTDERCTAVWGSTYQSQTMICAGGATAGQGVCMGDSGGPLVQTINGEQTLIGATSWAPSTCTVALPSGWAKLATVRKWILDNTNDLN